MTAVTNHNPVFRLVKHIHKHGKNEKEENWRFMMANSSYFSRIFAGFLMQHIDHLGNSLVELTIFVFSRFNLCFGFYFRVR